MIQRTLSSEQEQAFRAWLVDKCPLLTCPACLGTHTHPGWRTEIIGLFDVQDDAGGDQGARMLAGIRVLEGGGGDESDDP